MMSARQKQHHNTNYQLWKRLNEAMPGLFDMVEPKPLAVGFREFVIAGFPDVPTKQVKRFFRWWCHRSRYIEALAQSGAVRMKHDGTEAGPVSSKDRIQALAEISRHNQRLQEAR